MNSDPQKVLFAFDGTLFSDDKGNYYGVHVNDSIFDRYLNLGESLSLLVRTKKINEKDKNRIPKITNPYCNIVPVPNFKSITDFIGNGAKAKAIIREAVEQSSVIIARLPSAIGSYAVQFANEFNKPVLGEVVACNWDSFWYYNYKGKLVAPYFYWKQRKIIKNIDYAIYVTQHFLQDRYPNNGESIGCSDVSLKEIDNTILDKRLKKIEAQKSPLKLGTVAALNVPYKSQDNVINVVSKLKSKGIHFEYSLVGQGDDSRLRNLVKKLGLENEVNFVGTLKHAEVFNFLDEIDIYIHPSKQEGLPRAMVEALSRALPTLGARTAGIPELLNEEDIFDKGDEQAIEQMLANLDKEKMKEQASRNFEKSKNYIGEKLNQERLNFYHKFLNDHNLEIPNKLESKVKEFSNI
ncbi:glycosyltransferase [Fodinibius salsisoli]|uniref:Glycosyltransferase n=1 Tax=Fodinibius salsisoli TaxID=2820877 RepID=A0ABT3PLI5_9BACT|nr:glycosyltransferase [Fodinibius salsisoli]MCW9706772.1 glycosyltransferase [Fodinibius salsisoli]